MGRFSVRLFIHLSIRLSVRPFPPLGHSARRTDGQTDVCTENLPILQDFVPYRGRCPASQRKIYANKEKQGKGIADHLMPLGDWLPFLPFCLSCHSGPFGLFCPLAAFGLFCLFAVFAVLALLAFFLPFLPFLAVHTGGPTGTV